MGTGTEIGFVDMPIQREKATGFPKGEASGIKGVFRDISKHEEYFGKEEKNESDGDGKKTYEAGSLYFTDARLLFLPVRSMSNTFFVWVTCPFVLRRFISEIKGMKIEKTEADKLLKGIHEYRSLADDQFIPLTSMGKNKQEILLEELKFKVLKGKEKTIFPERYLIFQEKADYLNDKLKKDLFMISDAMFSYFCEMSTEVITRIKIGEDGVVKNGALFTEEFLPEYSIFYNVIGEIETKASSAGSDNGQAQGEESSECSSQVEVLLKEAGKELQLGGGKTIGKGITVYEYFLEELV